MPLLLFFLLWSFAGMILGFVLRFIFHILPVKTILLLCFAGYVLHMLSLHFL